MFSKLAFILLCIVLLAPSMIKGATFEELLSQITALQTQITSLQSQLTQLKQTVPESPVITFQKVLQMTDRNEEVRELQKILKNEGLFCERCLITGYFGYWTKAGLMNLQQKYKLSITGIVDRATRLKLNELAGMPSTTPPATTPSPAPAPTPSPAPLPVSPSPSPSTPKDTTRPTATIKINDGAADTTNSEVLLALTCKDSGSGVDSVRYSNISVFSNEPWVGFSEGYRWTLSKGEKNQTVYFQCQDKAGNIVTASDTIFFDEIAPLRSQGAPITSFAAGTTQITLSLKTHEKATCRYALTQDVDYDAMRDTDTFAGSGTVSHSIIVSPITPSGQQTYRVRCKDTLGNKNTHDFLISFQIAAPVPPQTSFFVKPYLVYPADKPMYPGYETAVNSYLTELQNWYKDKVGKTFTPKPLVVVRSAFDYLTMRCGPTPTATCLNDPSKLEGNWGMYMNMAIHNGVEQWEAETAALIFGAGGGGYAGANSFSGGGWAISGDWVLEPISGIPNTWGIPCSYSDGWQCAGGTPKGTPAHELGHAFGLPHPGEQYINQTIMQWHGNFPEPGLLQQEIDSLKTSPFFP
ncbi:MAG: peptidoglycan-binding protein [Candidatus Wildermuthbacteria bacterium]|nr:peptidoglycan-binding protein [Candidatus Wildermuthbacteria bacterium]